MGDVVRHEADLRRVQAGQAWREEVRRLLGVHLAHDVAVVEQPGLLRRPHQRGVEGVGDRVEVLGRQARPRPAPGGGELGQLPGAPRQRPLAVLAPAEPLLLGGGHDLAVDDQRRRRVVVDGVDAQDLHACTPPSRARSARSQSMIKPCRARRTASRRDDVRRTGPLGSDEQRCADEDLGAVGAVGVPSAAGISLDPEPVMDLRVVPFADQAGVLQAVSPPSIQWTRCGRRTSGWGR